MSSSIVRARWAPIVAVTLGVLVIGAAPEEVQGDLVGAVDTAFQPAHVSVWLPPRLRPGCRGR